MSGDCDEVGATRGIVEKWSSPGELPGEMQAGFRLFYNSYGCNLSPLQPRQKNQQMIFTLMRQKSVEAVLSSSEVSCAHRHTT